jgi:hypothetical protein
MEGLVKVLGQHVQQEPVPMTSFAFGEAMVTTGHTSIHATQEGQVLAPVKVIVVS